MPAMLQRIRDLPDQGLYGVIGVLAVAALYVIGFVIKNSKNVSVDFVLFSAGVPLITLMVVMLLFGALLGRVPDARAGTQTRDDGDDEHDRLPAPARQAAAGRAAARQPAGLKLSTSTRGREFESTSRRRAARRPARGGCPPRPARWW